VLECDLANASTTTQTQQQHIDTMPTATTNLKGNNHNRKEVQDTTLCVCREGRMATSVIWLELSSGEWLENPCTCTYITLPSSPPM
jgi:hypothetical protein